MTVEEIVARFEEEGGIISLQEMRALIASWRERGEAVEAMRAQCEAIARQQDGGTESAWSRSARYIAAAIAALKDKP